MKSLAFLSIWLLGIIPACPAIIHPGKARPARPDSLPVIAIPSSGHPDMPMVLMITGDGGYKGMEQRMAISFARQGSPVVSLNSLRYFWKKKTPSQTTAVVSSLLYQYLNLWNRKKLILIGYSFGADILPFVVNRLDKELYSRISLIVLMSPGKSVDFEVHIYQMLENGGNWKYQVPPQISRITGKPLLCIFGKKEKEYPVKDLHGPNVRVLYLEGGHHYGNNKLNLAHLILDEDPAGEMRETGSGKLTITGIPEKG